MAVCSDWLQREFQILRPRLVLPVGKLAISRFLDFPSLADVVGHQWQITYAGHATDIVPLPHPSGASTWHRMEPGKTLLGVALDLVARHPAVKEAARLKV